MSSCLKTDRANRVASIIQNIPSFEQNAIEFAQLCPQSSSNMDQCDGCRYAILEMLEVFDAINVADEKGKILVKSKSESSFYFLQSIARFVRLRMKIVDNWKRVLVEPKQTNKGSLVSGNQFLFAMENRRVNHYKDKEPIRKIDVSFSVIKAKVKNKKTMYLLHLDSEAHQFQLVGGKGHDDTDFEQIMSREINEELHGNNLEIGIDYSLTLLLKGEKILTNSITVGAYTEYTINMYHMKLLKPRQIILNENRWVTYEEIRKGLTYDGKVVGLEWLRDLEMKINQKKGFEALKLSTEAIQETAEQKDYQEVPKIINDTVKNQPVEFESMVSPKERDAWNKIVEGLDNIHDSAAELLSSSDLFGIDTEFLKGLKNRSHRIKTNIITSLSGLTEIEKRRGGMEQLPTDSMDHDKYCTTLQDMIEEYNDELLPKYESVVESLILNRTEIEVAIDKKRAAGEEAPEKPKVEELFNSATQKVNEAKSWKAKLKKSYSSAVALYNDVKPYVTPLLEAASFVMGIVGIKN
jgi:hypothetical protein